ncbi:MAG: type II toxin-antitoxin system HipA family toxin [Solirubrobacteraceae bacterium MAG38_C4-C5]|nr:type II toxin-antitoxin system HipA family toxin [Candidatus Siliceabacter maunaloa]
MAERIVDVVVQVAGEDVGAGRLWSHRRGTTASATFEYSAEYLARPGAYALDPALALVSGQQQTPAGRALFGAFTDCAPDRWGRRLIVRAEHQRVGEEGGASRSFGDIDYLLGVRDDLRQGALRFRDPRTGTYLADEHEGVPPLVRLPVLLGAAERLERDDVDATVLRTLLRGGSSLGGARPKAHILDSAGRVAIAKLPRRSTDEWDVIRWEAVALHLAREAGLRVPRHELHVFDDKAVLVVDRFDRAGAHRIAYASAMTMLEAIDGDQGSYTDIALVIEEQSPHATDDLRELWRRIAFSILISNTDDHLRNHGFLRASSGGWELAPAFDLNPNPEPGPKHLSTAIDDGETSARVELLMRAGPHFRLDDAAARAILREVSDATRRWREVAEQTGIDRATLEQMEPAFDNEHVAAAYQIADA